MIRMRVRDAVKIAVTLPVCQIEYRRAYDMVVADLGTPGGGRRWVNRLSDFCGNMAETEGTNDDRGSG
jgi:hypothetical protein